MSALKDLAYIADHLNRIPAFGDAIGSEVSKPQIALCGVYATAALAEHEATISERDRLKESNTELLAALRKVESRLTAAAVAFYEVGKPSALQIALSGWKLDAHQARAVIAKQEGGK